MSHEKNLGWLDYIGDHTIGFIINPYKDPYQLTGIMESRTVFFVAHVAFGSFFFKASMITCDRK